VTPVSAKLCWWHRTESMLQLASRKKNHCNHANVHRTVPKAMPSKEVGVSALHLRDSMSGMSLSSMIFRLPWWLDSTILSAWLIWCPDIGRTTMVMKHRGSQRSTPEKNPVIPDSTVEYGRMKRPECGPHCVQNAFMSRGTLSIIQQKTRWRLWPLELTGSRNANSS
jgi:hypothetical protein